MTILLNDIEIEGLELIGLRVGETYYREGAKSGVSYAYLSEGYQVKKAGARTVVLHGVFNVVSYAALQDGASQLMEMLGSEGLKSVEADGEYREVFAKDGFAVTQISVKTGTVTAKIEIPLTQVGGAVVDPDWLLDVDGEYVLDMEGKRILDNQ